MIKTHRHCVGILLSLLVSANIGCGTSSRKQLLAMDESQVKLRSIQTRAFDTNDKDKILRAVIATMQDLDFVLEKADETLGTVTGMKFRDNAMIRMSVSVRPRNESQMLVRANAQYGLKAVEDPLPYQDFFSALEKSLFLAAQQVD